MAEISEAKKPAAVPKPAVKAAAKPKKGDAAKDTLWSRRDLFSYSAWAMFAATLGLSSVYFLRLLFPRVLFEPSPKFKAGKPEDYTVGEVSSKWVKEYRVWIIRDRVKLYAIFARCTHLGCTPLWLKTEGKYKCPCHGSGFTMDGINFEGPAPRALDRLKVVVGPDGQIVVDKSKKFVYEKGQWDDAGSFISV